MKKIISVLAIVPLLTLTSISLYADQKVGPVKAINECMGQLNIKYGPDGHFYTTYKIAKLAGMNDKDVLALTYFSQYPDEDKSYDAIVNAFKNKIPFVGDQFSKDAVKKLHSLHGGGRSIIDARRNSLEKAISTNIKNQDNIWKAGLLIHAYADTYAHTKGDFNSQSEKAFGPAFGHAFHTLTGNDPDEFTNKANTPKYLAYVDNLFKVLKTKNANDKAFIDYKHIINNNKCGDDSCFTGKVLTKMELEEAEKFKTCMDSNMRSLTKNEVQGVLNQIK